MTIKTNTTYNFTEAEDDNFSWTTFDGTSGQLLIHKASGREIYQMHFCTNGKMAERVEGETRDLAIKFWDELGALKDQKPPRRIETYVEEEHGFGWCDKCQSYCYGDCDAN